MTHLENRSISQSYKSDCRRNYTISCVWFRDVGGSKNVGWTHVYTRTM